MSFTGGDFSPSGSDASRRESLQRLVCIVTNIMKWSVSWSVAWFRASVFGPAGARLSEECG